jgi:hypothetical protein
MAAVVMAAMERKMGPQDRQIRAAVVAVAVNSL